MPESRDERHGRRAPERELRRCAACAWTPCVHVMAVLVSLGRWEKKLIACLSFLESYLSYEVLVILVM